MNFVKNHKLPAFLLGTAASAGLFYGLYAYFRPEVAEDGSNTKVLTKEQVIKILKEMQKEFFSTFSSLAMIGMQIQQQSRNKIAPEELEYILSNQPHFTQEIGEIEAKIYRNHGVSEKEFRYACEEVFKGDADVQNLQKEMKNQMNGAIRGQLPDSKTDIPQFLTPEKTLKIYEKIMKTSAIKIKEVFQGLKAEGEDINLNNPRVLMALNNVKLDDIKKTILSEEGLNEFEDAPAKILQYASQKYSRENSAGFGDKMRVLELRHQKSVEAVFKNPDISEDFINEQFKDSPPVKKPEPPKVFKDELEKKEFALEKPEEVVEEKKEIAEEKKEIVEEVPVVSQEVKENQGNGEEKQEMPGVD